MVIYIERPFSGLYPHLSSEAVAKIINLQLISTHTGERHFNELFLICKVTRFRGFPVKVRGFRDSITQEDRDLPHTLSVATLFIP